MQCVGVAFVHYQLYRNDSPFQSIAVNILKGHSIKISFYSVAKKKIRFFFIDLKKKKNISSNKSNKYSL